MPKRAPSRGADSALRAKLAALLEEHVLSEILEGLAAEAAYWARRDETEAERAAWKRARAMVLKCVAVVAEIGL